MSNWVLILRGFDTDDQGILDAEQLIKDTFPSQRLRATTVVAWMYDEEYAKTKPFADQRSGWVPEHAAGAMPRRKGAQ